MTSLISIQASIISKIKQDAPILAKLGSVNEVRELEWVGDKFVYPNIRVRVDNFKRHTPDCDIFDIDVHIYVFGDLASSLSVNTICGMLFDLFDRNHVTNGGIRTTSRIEALQLGAMYVQEDGVWRGELSFPMQVK